MSLHAAVIYSTSAYKFEGPTIIYCPSRKATEQVVSELMKLKVPCAAYHAGMGIKQRRETHHQFMRDEIQVCRKLSLLVLSFMIVESLVEERIWKYQRISHLLCLQFWAKKLLLNADSKKIPGLFQISLAGFLKIHCI